MLVHGTGKLRRRLPWPAVLLGAALALVAVPRGLLGQTVVACDFDIDDEQGDYMFGNTLHLTGPPGVATQRGSFHIINGTTSDQDVDHDGYSTNCDYTRLYIPPSQKTNLVNVENPSLTIPAENVVIASLPRALPHGTQAQVFVVVSIPEGTVTGRYLGSFAVADSLIPSVGGPNNEPLNIDAVNVEVIVTAQAGLTLVDPEAARQLDSVVVRGRAGQSASGVLRIANTGNATLSDVRLSATDLRSESAVGLIIPAQNVIFSPPSFSSLAVSDTVRVTVTVRIPRGILGGRYRGSIVVQGNGGVPGEVTGGGGAGGVATRREIPLVVIVTSSRGILFANNPVRSVLGDIAQIAFNGDPGTPYRVLIFDMGGLVVLKASGTVFPGIAAGGGPGTPQSPGVGADFAVNYAWPLTNGRGENVASGMYLVVVESIVSGRRQLARDRLMVIR
jgi:hypothetical protein